MIKRIIKRDGRRQEFDPNKINGWGEWAAAALGKTVDWGEVVLHVVSTSPEEVTSQQLQESLIDYCITKQSWAYSRMAGKLYSAMIFKKYYNNVVPTIYELHTRMVAAGVMDSRFMSLYSHDEYNQIDNIINHKRDLTYAHYQHKQVRDKYALKDRVNDIDFETPQFVFMRVAMRLAANTKDKMKNLERFYYYFSTCKINVPTPYFTNSGTDKNGFLSCCLYTTKDTAPSLAAGDHIAYMMTVNSAGIGANITSRTIGSKVRGGTIKHQGKLPYYKALAEAVSANTQNGRGGAATVTFSIYDPQIETLLKLKNPMTPEVLKIRKLDYSVAYNRFFAQAAAKNQPYYTFSHDEAPELYDAITSKDDQLFEKWYNHYVEKGTYKSKLDARDVLRTLLNESVETGRIYVCNLSEMNKHTPFIEPINNSNLCQEVALPTTGYDSVYELYQENESGEVAMCALSGIVVPNIKDDEEYADAAYYALLMIDVAINETEYPFPQVKWTATKRMSAGVGIVGLAHLMAKHHLSYETKKGKEFIHQLSETHYWHLLNASLKLGQELGNAEWMHKTLWPQGYLPIDTYNKNVDNIIDAPYNRDWEGLRAKIIENKGVRFSCVCAHMPAESSSIISGTTNGVYPVRQLSLVKTSETSSTNYVVPESDKLKLFYDIVWDLDSKDIIECYAILQKFCDQAISADLWKVVVGNDKISSSELLKDFFAMTKYGVKTRYYVNSRTSKGIDLNQSEQGCSSGGCSL